MTWFSPHTTCGYATPNAWLFHVLDHTMYVGFRWMEGEVDKRFCVDISGAVLVMYQHYSSLVQGSGIQHLVWYCKGCIPGLRLFQSKQSTHDVFCTFLSGVVMIQELCIIKMAFIPVFFICL